MAKIGFIGLGNMGLPMALNLLRAGHQVVGFDVVNSALTQFAAANGTAADSAMSACADVDVVITMLPAGEHVRGVYLGDKGIIAKAPSKALLIDCSTIDVATARAVAAAAGERGCRAASAERKGRR
jgi:3-hydroxyisobutyrate dehydrogenase